MSDVIDPETGETRPSRLALRGQRPTLADLAAAARCRLRHVTWTGDLVDAVPHAFVSGADIYGRARTDAEITRGDEAWHNPGHAFVIFDGGAPLDRCVTLRPPDELNTDHDPERLGPHKWWVGPRAEAALVMSSRDGVRVLAGQAVAEEGQPLSRAELADLIAALAAAQDDQRARFAVGDPEPRAEATDGRT